MPVTGSAELARKLVLVLAHRDREEFEALQVRLARVVSRLWEVFADLLESHAALTSGRGAADPVDLTEFRPGDTLRLGSSMARTDPRLVLAERLHITGWQDLIEDLAVAVLHAPDLARQEIVELLRDLDAGFLRELEGRFSPEEDTEEFPAQPRQDGT